MKSQTPVFSFVIITLTAALALFSGCGYDPNQSVYDYTLNPDGFPTEAISVIKGVETDSIAGYSAITMAFGQLYSARPDLLDNPDWQIIIQRLGAQFGKRLGIDAFKEVGGCEDVTLPGEGSNVGWEVHIHAHIGG